MVKTLTFQNCWVHIDEEAQFLQTVFRDESRVTCTPEFARDAETAARLGYGEDRAAILRLWREHDLIHTILAEAQNLPYSPTLWAVAHPDDPDSIPEWAQAEEEELVLSFQKWMNTGELSDSVRWLVKEGYDLEEIRQSVRTRLDGSSA